MDSKFTRLIPECEKNKFVRADRQMFKLKGSIYMHEEIIRQIQELNQKLIEQDVCAGGRGYYKVLDKMPYPDKKNIFFALSLENKKEYLIEFAPQDLNPIDMQKYLRRALFLMVLDQDKGVMSAKDFSIDPTRCFIITNWVEGKNLYSIIKHTRLYLTEILWIMADLTCALEHLAEFGFVHRNVNPQNITIQSKTGRSYLGGVEYVTLSDFVNTQLDISNNYASPELVRSLLLPESNEPLTPWSDVYSLGAIFYHLVCGEMPFLADRNIEKWCKKPYIPKIKSEFLNRRERKYCQELIDNTMYPKFLKRWSPGRIRRYIMAFLGENKKEEDMVRFL